MRIIQRLTILAFAVFTILFAGLRVWRTMTEDRTAPVLTCSSDMLEVSVKGSEKDLLAGVSAYDNRDGDLTGEIIVSGVSQLLPGDTAKVTYAVFDRSNNMTTMRRTIHYTDYTAPHFSMSAPLTFRIGETVALLDRLTATDCIDGDVTDSIRVSSHNISTGYAGTYSIRVQVSNSLGDTENLTLPVCVHSEATPRQLVELKQYILYLDRGASFAPEDWFQRAVNFTGSSVPYSEISVTNPVDTGTAGVYNVAYSNRTYTAYLTVVVK